MSSSSKPRRASVDKPQAYLTRLEPDVYNAAASFANATSATSINAFLNNAAAYYVASGQAAIDFRVTNADEKDTLQAAIDKLSGD